MATRSFFDTLVALRIIPLLTSTCALYYAWDQYFFLAIYILPSHQKSSKSIIPSHFTYFFRRGVWSVLGTLALTLSTSTTNLYFERDALRARQSFKWYLAGAVLSAAHLLFVPFVAPSVKALIDDRTGDTAVDGLRRWLGVHLVRTVTVDLAAWVSFAVAVTRSVKC